MAVIATIVLIIILLPDVTGGPSHCSVTAVENGVIQCFANEEINIPELFERYRGTNSFDFNVEDIFILGDKDMLCGSQKGNLKRAVQCGLHVINHCLHGPPVITTSSLLEVVEKTCQYRDVIDFQCTRNKTDQLKDCALRKASGNSTDSLTHSQIPCFVSGINIDCLKIELKSCGCITAKLQSDMALDELTPRSCNMSTHEMRRVVCSTSDPQAFEYDGLGVPPKDGDGLGGGAAKLRVALLLPVAVAVVMTRLIALVF